MQLVAGQVYTFNSHYGWFTIMDQYGNPLSSNFETGSSLQLEFLAPRTGVYHLETSARDGYSGSYYLSVNSEIPDNASPTNTVSGPTNQAADDYAGSTATSGALNVADGRALITGNIESSRDRDYFRVHLVSGHTYRFDLNGSTLRDSILMVQHLEILMDHN